MITLDEAKEMLAEAERDFEADTGGCADEVWYDLVVATAHNILLEHPGCEDVAREFCRTEVGSIPHDLEPMLGRKDWIQ